MQLEHAFYTSIACHVHEWKLCYHNFPPKGVLSSIMQFSRMMSGYMRTIISTRQLLGGCQARAVIMCKAAERLLSLKCQNDSPPPSWPQLCRETQLIHVELPRVREHTRLYRDTDHTDWVKWAAPRPSREMLNLFFYHSHYCYNKHELHEG